MYLRMEEQYRARVEKQDEEFRQAYLARPGRAKRFATMEITCGRAHLGPAAEGTEGEGSTRTSEQQGQHDQLFILWQQAPLHAWLCTAAVSLRGQPCAVCHALRCQQARWRP